MIWHSRTITWIRRSHQNPDPQKVGTEWNRVKLLCAIEPAPYTAFPLRTSSVRSSLWACQTWAPNELSSSCIPPPCWWGSWSFGGDRGPGTRRPDLWLEFSCSHSLKRCHCLGSTSASASSACEAGCLAGPEEDAVSDPHEHRKNCHRHYKRIIMINFQRKKKVWLPCGLYLS